MSSACSPPAWQLPKSLVPHYCQMVSANPKSRPNPATLLSSLREHGGYLSNQFISIALRIEELQVCRLYVSARSTYVQVVLSQWARDNCMQRN